ncbi:MAG: TraR/DksA family transcriptional regulator [Bdellovibrionales bacterium]|nr:TraR/DksA family transcriptional regulator [Bdellovibrionales bacterium]
MNNLSKDIVTVCKMKLIDLRTELLDQLAQQRKEHMERDVGRDDIDASQEVLAEHQFLTTNTRIRKQIIEIDHALGRIERGIFGVCEETEEPIEASRLMAIPWTRVSLEGAELREERSKRFA